MLPERLIKSASLRRGSVDKSYPQKEIDVITIAYKGWWILYRMQSRYYGLSEETKVRSPDGSLRTVKSVHAAKCVITRMIKASK